MDKLKIVRSSVKSFPQTVLCPDTTGIFFPKLLKDDWSEEDLLQVTNLCLEWYLPVPTRETNRLLLFQQMLSHSVSEFYLYFLYHKDFVLELSN